jgi:hypothetical protein
MKNFRGWVLIIRKCRMHTRPSHPGWGSHPYPFFNASVARPKERAKQQTTLLLPVDSVGDVHTPYSYPKPLSILLLDLLPQWHSLLLPPLETWRFERRGRGFESGRADGDHHPTCRLRRIARCCVRARVYSGSEKGTFVGFIAKTAEPSKACIPCNKNRNRKRQDSLRAG